MSSSAMNENRDHYNTTLSSSSEIINKNNLSTTNWDSFWFLNICQFVGAMNDNIFKLLLIYFCIMIEGNRASSFILSLTGAIYVLPFLFLASISGTIADRYSKKKIIVITRGVEIIIMILGIVGFALKSPVIAFIALFCLASHSAIFAPCKYGIVPEVVGQEDISKANGLLTSCTYIAIITGTFLASFLADITSKNFVIAATFCVICSCISFWASTRIQKTPPSGSKKKISPRLISELIRNLKIIGKEPSLLSAVIGSSFFLFIGSFVQLNMIPFAMKVLHLSDVQGGYMFLLTAFGIGTGSYLAGRLSGKSVEFGLVPIGGIGMALSCFLIDYYSESLPHILIIIYMVGFFGGMYLVPLDSYIQVASPKTHRGQVVATTNFFGFLGVLGSAGAIYINSEVLQLEPDKGFTFVGILTVIIVISISISMSGYIVRFFSFLFSYVFFPASLKGKDGVPIDRPSIFIVPQIFWPWAAVLLASQRRRVRLLTMKAMNENPPLFAKIARRLIPILVIHDLKELMPGAINEELIRHALSRRTSVALFCTKKTLQEQMVDFVQAWSQDAATKELRFFSITVPEESSDTLPKQGELSLSAQVQEIPRV